MVNYTVSVKYHSEIFLSVPVWYVYGYTVPVI